MSSQNSFDKTQLASWFTYNYECWKCGKNHWNCFHHIMGRGGTSGSKVEKSILNCAPLNNFECHLQIHGELMTEKNQKILLQKTMRYLLKQDYKFNDIDKAFIIKYKEYYEV